MAKFAKSKIDYVKIAAEEAGKVPPQAVDMEKAVLGALMLEKNAIIDIHGILSAESFYLEQHQRIYRAILGLSSRHEAIDIYTIANELKSNGDLEFVGGVAYLASLSEKVGSAAHIEYHSKIVAQKSIQRRLIEVSSEIQREAFDDKNDVKDLLDMSQQKIFEIAEGNISTETRHISGIITDATKEMEQLAQREDGFTGVPSGFTELDRLTYGWQPSDLIIVAARPSMGKTAFVLSMARSISVEFKKGIAFFSLEMSSLQLVKRLITSETGLDPDKIKTGKLNDNEWRMLDLKLQDLENAPFYIDDTPALSIFEFRSKARKLVLNHDIKLIIIDYLQLMVGPPETKGMREQEVSSISRSLKAIAKELNVPIIALSQLNRSVETRTGNKRPQLSDLRESGAIEQDADLVAFIHRPEYYGFTEDEEQNSLIGIAEIILAKHRNGAVGEIKLRFRKLEAKFCDLSDIGDSPTSDTIIMSSKMNNYDSFNTGSGFSSGAKSFDPLPTDHDF
ncbi:MAG: replicative DNA helicase [Prevotellaceae bacterium]|jgi:replicative DNA helicase|nr:replicative DNA helicase [Prevotellaceae bacterium]